MGSPQEGFVGVAFSSSPTYLSRCLPAVYVSLEKNVAPKLLCTFDVGLLVVRKVYYGLKVSDIYC